MPLLEIRNVTRRFGDLRAVDDVSLAVEPGEFFTLLGPSGCGKTTLLRMIAGFDLPDAGQIVLDGKDMADTPPEKRPIHTVFQSYALFPHMTVANNIAFPLRMAGKSQGEIDQRVRESLELVHLEAKGKAYPSELSGGQRQRLAHAPRDLLARPAGHLQGKGDVSRDRHVREERVALEHRVDGSPFGRRVLEVDAVEHDGAGIGQVESGNHSQERGLAAARRPEQREKLARVDRKADVIDRNEVAEASGDVADFEQRHRRLSRGRWTARNCSGIRCRATKRPTTFGASG
jgi:ABC-type ATPase involved in cell division